ncbi:MAG: 23S rRNA (guanosine(2251)-2'-O)-methyltransferase RlmB [Bacilli bacterium]|jgi:23S rRNA (guanosine2251-2'-O)-methyltransferase
MSKLIYGRNSVLSSLGENRVEKIFLDNDFDNHDILKIITRKKIAIERVNREKLEQLSNHGIHQGIAALVLDFRYYSLDEILESCRYKKYPLIVILDELKDPHNLGAIIRTCDAFDVDGIIIKKYEQVPLNATVAKVSTGAIDFVKVAVVSNLSNVLNKLKEAGFWIIASDGQGDASYRDIDYLRSIALILGSEGKGVSRLLLERSDYVVKVPMLGHVNSLNVSVAAGILLSEIVAKR